MTAPPQPAPGLAPPGRPACRHCGGALTPHQAASGAVCAAPACQRKKIEEASRAAFQRNWDDYAERQRAAAERAAPQIALALRRLDAPAGGVAIGVVPRQERPLLPLPAERRAAFEARLDEIIAAAFARPLPELDLTDRRREEAAEDPLIDATCTLCQGLCCSLGGARHAFLEVSDIQRYRLRHPEVPAAEVRAHYLGHLPERSVEHACVFQSATGCTLARRDRADLCNRYHCNPQSHLLSRMRETAAETSVIVAHEGEAGPVVAAFDKRTGGLHRVGEPVPGGDAVDPAEAIAALDAALAQVPAPLPKLGPDLLPEPARCEFCGTALDRHQAASTRCCGAPACQSARLQRVAKAVTESQHDRFLARWEAVLDRARPALAAAAAEAGIPSGAALEVAVPFQDRPLEPPPAARRAAFEAHLEAILAAAFARPPGPMDLAERDRNEAPEERVLDACCATCQGACCARGGETMAFLTETDIDRYRLRHPSATLAEVRAAYLGRLPERSVSGACLFQSATGCTLPRSQRADICNGFNCTARAEVARLWRDRPPGPVLVVAHADDSDRPEPRNLAVFDPENGYRRAKGPVAEER